MLLSELKYNKNLKLLIVQTVVLQCDICGKVWEMSDIRTYLKQEITGIHKCFICSRNPGLKGKHLSNETKQKISAANKGVTWEYKYTKNVEEEMRQKASQRISMYNQGTKNLSLEERLGEEKAKRVREQRSKNVTGEKNPMYGKPPPKGVGISIQGWYKNWFFRSLKELSYMLNVIEKEGLQWESGENKKYRIPYFYKDQWRNYFPDFVIQDAIIEIKPFYWIHNSEIIKVKKEYAEKWCVERGYTYKLISEKDYPQLTKQDLVSLIKNNKVIFLKNYIIKGVSLSN